MSMVPLGPVRTCGRSRVPPDGRGRRTLVALVPAFALAACAFAVAACVCAVTACASAPALELRPGFEPDGAPTAEWRAAVEAHDGTRPAWEPHALTAAEDAWLERMRSRLPAWEARLPELCVPFEGLRPPRRVVIVAGNQHGEDAFGLGGPTIYFDLSALVRIYGAADEPPNPARLDRILDHEITHVLHWRWERAHPQPVDTPLERALWAMAREGLGNLRSLSETWVGPDGEPTPLARDTLAKLEPILVDRLDKLARASEAEEPGLAAGLSQGPFAGKWGALPVALWLAQETRGDDRRLSPWVAAGSAGVLALARRHLPPELAARLPQDVGRAPAIDRAAAP